ncbi:MULTISPECIES: hypothetical protein [Klebsiella]|uniref:hypothetical protein n=1 Tax=Klebsiella TaxID=570 RepID=UPI00159F5C39|nr:MULTISPECIES: hypothetical protein [Klebsiella]HCB0355792.1 hypothetical protein [Klebsiella variicola subsp. variicola]
MQMHDGPKSAPVLMAPTRYEPFWIMRIHAHFGDFDAHNILEARQPSRKTKVSKLSVKLPSRIQIKTDPYQPLSYVVKSYTHISTSLIKEKHGSE